MSNSIFKEFDPVDNQKFADLAGVLFDSSVLGDGPVIYGITHLTHHQFRMTKKIGLCILITTYSDASLTQKMVRSMPSNIKFWFSTNVMVDHPRVIPIPIGFAFKRGHQDLCMNRRREPRPARRNLMYMNFYRNIVRHRTNPREGMYEQFGGFDWVTVEGGMPDCYVAIEDFYTGVQTHDYVLSPPGAGLDCHRHWEAMALGSVPIVLRSRATDILDDMPCLRVDHWDEVTEDRLIGELPALQERFTHDSMKKMDMNYWKAWIKHETRMLRDTP